MASIATHLMAWPPPEVEEVPGVPELFCDALVVHPAGETVRLLLCRHVVGKGEQALVSGILFMPYGGFVRSLGWAATQFLKLGQ